MASAPPHGTRTGTIRRLRQQIGRSREGSDPPPALVIGSSCTEVVRPLALSGIRCLVVASPGDGAQHSRYAMRLFDWDWDQPNEAHGEELLERLLMFGRRQTEKPVLYFCSEQALVFTSRFRTQLEEVYRFVVATSELVESLSDKEQFHALSTRFALPVPRTCVAETGSALADMELDGFQFPLIVKPNRRYTSWTSEEPAKARRVDSIGELRSLADHLAGSDLSFVVQECIDGPESAIESYHVYVNDEGDVRAEFTGRKIRTWPARYGYSTALILTREEDVRLLGRRLVKDLGLTGVAKFDFKRSAAGELHLLEVNARFNLWHHLGATAGINLPAVLYEDLTGHRVRAIRAVKADGATWVHPKDLRAARDAGMPFGSWLVWAARCDAKAFWRWDDPLPLLAMLAARARTAVGRRIARPGSRTTWPNSG